MVGDNMTTNNGGPAFPCDHLVDDDGVSLSSGMTLRDYFAAKAMQGDISRVGYYQREEHMLTAAKNAYAMADAMLRAREIT